MAELFGSWLRNQGMQNRKHQFGLGTLLLVFVLVAIPLALYRSHVDNGQFGIRDGKTRLPPSKGMNCFVDLDDGGQERHYIKGPDAQAWFDLD